MDRECDEADDNTPLCEVNRERTSSDSNLNSAARGTGSHETIVFDSKMMKTSTHTEDLAATWGGRRSLQDSGRLRRVHSWSGGPPDDISSEIIILRERLVRTQTRLQPGAVRNLSSRQRLTLASLALVDFMSFCSMSVMAPFFPREAAAKGLSETMCGIVFSFYAVVMFLTSPLFGKFLPMVGAKFLFTAGMFIAGACNVLFGTLALIEDTVTFTTLCFVVRGMEALGASAYSTASYVFVVNTFPDSIGSVLGILETFIGLGMSVGPAIGGLLYTIGGFGLPFYTLGVIMVLTVPINFFLLTDCEEYVSGSKTASIIGLFKIPSIIITGLVIVIVSNTWAFLDPTLEPHLRQFGLSTEQIGLIFLLFSSLYGIFSPIWGWVADRVHNHWCMMVWGLFLSSAGLLLLGPCPFIPGLPRDLWLDLVALSILGMSVALTLLPTFQGVLTSSIYEGGCPEALATYSAVAGVWSCCYSLGEVLGPALGGALTERYGFPLCATLCAAACFTMAVVTLTFFSLRESRKCQSVGSACDSIPYTDSTWNSNNFCRTRSAPHALAEHEPLLTPCSCYNNHSFTYGASPPKHFCLLHSKGNKSGYASIAEIAAYILKFQFVTSFYVKIRKSRRKSVAAPVNAPMLNEELYQNYIEKERDESNIKQRRNSNGYINMTKKSDKYCTYLEDAIFGSPDIMDNVTAEHLKVKRYNMGLVSTEKRCEEERRTTYEIIRHNLEKVQFYEQDECPSYGDIFDSCACRDGVTYVRGTVTVSSTGACEV
ncbi:MFS-type transporter SLC18B1-like [Helicoverpa zea]|uniref:MFS-type transporter SLC18B1-like n=1 Tax=Helicoverpa zea TaxID=7113 RepID=UPI001F56CAB8|nr:MFS-type transporter SLC18B1-like [Helicoverpa zea]XP_047028540.1 MFS-type transporter SLC18B1-like [Helicoverpa zea]